MPASAAEEQRRTAFLEERRRDLARRCFTEGVEEGRRLGELEGAEAFLALADAVAALAYQRGRASVWGVSTPLAIAELLGTASPPTAAECLAGLRFEDGAGDAGEGCEGATNEA